MKIVTSTFFLLASACVPVPYLTPPAHISIDAHPNPDYTGEIDDETSPISNNIAIGLAPMGAFSSMDKRKIDVYSGLFLHHSEASGLFVGFDSWPFRKQFGSRNAIRAGFTGRAALLGLENAWGTHYKAGITAELMTRLRAKDGHVYQKDMNSIGILFGEAGIGMDLCMFVDTIEDNNLIGTVFSLDFRIPTGAGVTFIPLERLKK